jgi:pyruvate kinase
MTIPNTKETPVHRVPQIMASVGPTLEKTEDLRLAIQAGARWFRLPCGYRQRPHLENARSVRQATSDCGVPVGLLLDLPSSRPRTGTMEDLHLEVGSKAIFWDPRNSSAAPAEPGCAPVPLPDLTSFIDKLVRGQRIWFVDGRLEFIVDELRSGSVVARLTRGGIPLKTSNSATLPDSPSPYAMLTAEDRSLLAQFAEEGLTPDWVALSLVCSPEDVRSGRRQVHDQLGQRVRMMAKFETAAAVDQLDGILNEADGIMVARGDLAPAVEYYRLPEVQERLVAAAHRAGKVVVVATQILETFAASGVPQRSELSDLALIARQGPDAIMLGKETVFSPHPIESIRFAARVLQYEVSRLQARGSRLPASLASSPAGPFVVAIEGPNGAGKTHLSALLAQRLGCPLLRGVPGAWEEPAMKMRMIHDADWLASAMYFLSGVIEASREAAAEGTLRVMDRSIWSTLAVHYAHDPRRLDVLLPLVELAADRVKVPNLTIVLEASLDVCRKRIARKTGRQQAFDSAAFDSEEFHRREREFYRWLATQGPAVVFLDADRCDPEEVCRQAADHIRESLPC